MSTLTKTQIIERLASGDLIFTPPLDNFQLQAHSVDLRLGFTFLIPKMWRLTSKGREAITLSPLESQGADHFEVIELEQGQYFDLLPQEYVLVSTLESIKFPQDIMSVLYPRSSTNRKGLSVDLTGIIDAGYEGRLTLPVRNNTRAQTIRLYPGERFCQIVFEELKNPVEARQSRHHKRDIVEGLAKENMTEIDLVISGDIKKLKELHQIRTNPPEHA